MLAEFAFGTRGLGYFGEKQLRSGLKVRASRRIMTVGLRHNGGSNRVKTVAFTSSILPGD